jgi:hypothetical protein
MTRQRPPLPPSLMTRRRLTKADVDALSGSPDSPFSRARAWLKNEVERRRQLRVLALEHYGIDDTQSNWRDRYIERLEERVFPAFQLGSPTGRPTQEREIDPLFIVARLGLSRDGDGNRLRVRAAALLLAREQLGPSATGAQVEEKADYYIEVRKRWRRMGRERSSNISNRNGAN